MKHEQLDDLSNTNPGKTKWIFACSSRNIPSLYEFSAWRSLAFLVVNDMRMFNLKQHFLLDPSVVFLNHGSFGATPRPVFDEYQRWQRELENQPVEFLARRCAGLMADSRAVLGEYLGTHADNLVYTQNVTISLNIIARSLELGADDEVLTSD